MTNTRNRNRAAGINTDNDDGDDDDDGCSGHWFSNSLTNHLTHLFITCSVRNRRGVISSSSTSGDPVCDPEEEDKYRKVEDSRRQR